MTTKISRVNYGMQAGRINGLVQSIIQKKSQLGDITGTHLETVFEKLASKQAALNEAIMREREKSDMTRRMQVLKTKFRYFYRLLHAYSNLEEADFQPDAQAILAVVRPYSRKITRCFQYLTCASYVSSLITDLEAPELIPQILAMPQIEASIVALKMEQKSLIKRHADFHDLLTQQRVKLNASELRLESLQCVNAELVDYLNAMSLVETVDYSVFSDTLNGIIKNHNSILKRQKTRSAQAAGGEELEVEPA